MFDENDLPHELLLTARQKTKLRIAFNQNMSTNIKLSKDQISKIDQSGQFLGSLLNKLACPLMKVVVPLAKNSLAPLGKTAAALAIDAGIRKKIHGSSCPSSSFFVMEKNGFLMPPHPLTSFKMQKYYQNEPRFNGVYSRKNLPKRIKDGAYVINLDENTDVGTHWVALFCRRSEIVYFDSFGVEHKNIIANIFQVQANNSVICGYFSIGFIDFMLAGKKLTDFSDMFSPYDFEKNDSIILSYCKNE